MKKKNETNINYNKSYSFKKRNKMMALHEAQQWMIFCIVIMMKTLGTALTIRILYCPLGKILGRGGREAVCV